jgi:1-hydroxycarotenoid 3,4-desaturase
MANLSVLETDCLISAVECDANQGIILSMVKNRVLVIGAGLGGLACAIDLVRQGQNVTVIERAGQSGGKLRQIIVQGRAIDSGPTVLTMRWVFDDLFAAAGADVRSYVAMTPLKVLARHAWSDAEKLDLFSDIAQTTKAIGAFSGPDEAARFTQFCSDSKRIYQTLKDSFLTNTRPNVFSLPFRIGIRRLEDLASIRPFSTLWSALGNYFLDPRLRQLFGRYATYVGSSPFLSPATLMLIAHVEQDGVWSVKGGMHKLAKGLEELSKAKGVTFRFNSDVREIVIRRNSVQGVTLTTGEHIEADAIVMNGDPSALVSGLLGTSAQTALAASHSSPKSRSLSAITWSLIGRPQGFDLEHHNVFFSTDYKSEFDQLFTQGVMPSDPTVYVCAQDRSADYDDPTSDGKERLFILANAPALGDAGAFEPAVVSECQYRVFQTLQRCGLRIQAASSETVLTTPAGFHGLFPGTGGALYGQTTHGPLAAFRRANSHTKIRGLYLAGGGTHPGAGMPMAILSGRLAAQRLLMDRRST